MQDIAGTLLTSLLKGLVINIFAAINVLFLIYLERKISAFIQRRLGPHRVGPGGILQTLADGVKVLQKELLVPRHTDKWLYLLAPVVALIPAMLVWVVIPFGPNAIATDLNIGIIYIAAVSSYAVVAVFMSGWGSNNKYSLLGAMRGAAQMISYEVTLVLSIIGVVLMAGSLSLQDIVFAQAARGMGGWYLFPQLIGFVVFLIASLAELMRAPFDLTEAESELVAGYQTEYSGMAFLMFPFAEYTHLLAWSAIASSLFLGGWVGPTPADIPVVGAYLSFTTAGVLQYFWPFFWLMFKTYLFVFLVMWIRWTLPRVRVDQLMDLGWKFLLPVALFNIFLTGIMRYLALEFPHNWFLGFWR